MNERIQKLAEQAQKIVGYLDGGYTEIKALDQEKFAELIVRECAEYAEHELDMAGYKKKFMLKHFGVKE